MKIFGSGLTNVDLIFTGVPALPKEGEEIYSKGFSVKLGGGAPATLINLSRLGLKTEVVTSLGDDMFSCFAEKEYEKAGVKITNIKSKGFPLNLTAVAVTDSDRTFLTYGGQPVSALYREQVRSSAKNADIIIAEKGLEEEYYAFKNTNKIILCDTGFNSDMNIENHKALLELSDYYLPNRKEAQILTGETDIKRAAVKLSSFFKTVIIKLDSEGALVFTDGKFILIPPIKEFKRVDSTGAGDAFLSGFIYGIALGKDPAESVLIGNITGGKCVTGIGCLTEYATQNEIAHYFNKYRTLISFL